LLCSYTFLLILDLLVSGFPAESFASRILTFIVQLLVIAFLIYFLLSRKSNKIIKDNFVLNRVALVSSQFLCLMLVFALLGNFLGITRLSLQLTQGTINTIGIGLLLFLIFYLLKLSFFFLEAPIIRSMYLIINHKTRVRKRLIQYTEILILFVFIRSLLFQLDFAQHIIDAWYELVNKSWEFGKVQVS